MTAATSTGSVDGRAGAEAVAAGAGAVGAGGGAGAAGGAIALVDEAAGSTDGARPPRTNRRAARPTPITAAAPEAIQASTHRRLDAGGGSGVTSAAPVRNAVIWARGRADAGRVTASL